MKLKLSFEQNINITLTNPLYQKNHKYSGYLNFHPNHLSFACMLIINILINCYQL